MARMEVTLSETGEAAGAGGTPDALFELGLMHCAGRDAALDLVNAHKWFNLAAMRGNEDAKRYRMEISREMSRRDRRGPAPRARVADAALTRLADREQGRFGLEHSPQSDVAAEA